MKFPAECVDELVYNISEPRLITGLNGPLAYWCNHGLGKQPNQDAQYINTLHNLFVSIDGMGGHSGGDIAAQILVEEFQSAIRDWRCFEKGMAEEVHERAAPRMKARIGEGGACYAAFRILEDELQLSYAGDERIIVLDEDRNIVFQTQDQSSDGIVFNAVSGMGPSRVHYEKFKIKPGYTIIAGSDGLWGACASEEVAELSKDRKALELLQALRTTVLERMTERKARKDNINIIVYDVAELVHIP